MEKIIELARPFIKEWKALEKVNAVLPVPSSNKNRMYQPAEEIAHEIAEFLKVYYQDDILEKVASKQS